VISDFGCSISDLNIHFRVSMTRRSTLNALRFFLSFVVKFFFFIIPNLLYAQQDTIKIGLLLQNQGHVSVVNAANLAIEKANRESNKVFALEVRSMEGPWGTGGVKSVDLVFGEEVWAVIASADGRNSHLAEQVSAKTQVVFMSAWSGDPTLAQAFVPWYYCVLPNYLQQAEVITRKISGSKKGGKTIIIATEDYDSRLAASGFRKVFSGYGFPEPAIVPEKDISVAAGNGFSTAVLFCQPDRSVEIIKKIKQVCKECNIITWLITGEKDLTENEIKEIEGALVISPGFYFTEKGNLFRSEYYKKFGNQPGAAAALTYDGVNVIIAASQKARDQNDLMYHISSMVLEGSTGIIKFDKNGNRKGSPELMKAEKGRFVRLKN
jgi:branched-chain amino acid transport system substrate-binding protein